LVHYVITELGVSCVRFTGESAIGMKTSNSSCTCQANENER